MMAIFEGILQSLWEYSSPYWNWAEIEELIRNPLDSLPFKKISYF
jgi:hypothetical protein